MTKGWIITGIIAVVVLGGAVAYHHYQAAGAAAAPKVHTAVVIKGTLAVHVYATGNVQANRTVDIKCQAGGKITSLPLDNENSKDQIQIGDLVKKGQVILTVDPTLELQAVTIAQQDLNQAKLTLDTAELSYEISRRNLITSRQTDEANLLSAEAQVKNDQLNVQRDLTLLKENIAAQQTYDADYTMLVRDQQSARLAEIQIEQLKQQALQVKLQKLNTQLDQVAIQKAQASLAQARTNLRYCKVKAPFTGYVANVDVQQGQIIASATNNVGGGTTVMALVDTSHIYVNATINESDINHVKIGEKVQITAAGAPGVVFPGRVVLIAPESIQDQTSGGTNPSTSNIVTFQAKIEVLGKRKQLLKPGMTANVDIFADKLPNVLYIPLQAVVIQNDEDTVTVVMPDGKQISKPVTLGERNDLDWQVLHGLKSGQKVVLHLGNVSSMWTPGWMRH
ncbi:MAG: efflux RND transporter periplasmic adaptor subunit [Planctomycetia bacterium]|nr:efflux RND transporter periplasmic adaptor subunit [Planctomycetia bacterium]